MPKHLFSKVCVRSQLAVGISEELLLKKCYSLARCQVIGDTVICSKIECVVVFLNIYIESVFVDRAKPEKAEYGLNVLT